MEIYAFLILAGLYMAVIFVLLGVIAGEVDARLNKKRNKGDSRHVREVDNNSVIRHDRDNNGHNRIVGNVYRKKHRGRDMGVPCYRNGQITDECTALALRQIRREMRTMLSQTEKDALEHSASLFELMLDHEPELREIFRNNEDLMRLCSVTGKSAGDLIELATQGRIKIVTGV